MWTWTAIEAESKLLISYLVGGRDGDFAFALMDDLRQRIVNRVQLTTDGHKAYLEAVEEALGDAVDHAPRGKTAGGGGGKSQPAHRCLAGRGMPRVVPEMAGEGLPRRA